ncbi:DNA/RNA polymerases superfamily protein isoform X2 [Wolffia australiana]
MGTTSNGDRPWESCHTVYTNAKAGMDGVDKEKVQRVIYEMSKGSKYFENEQRKDAILKEKIERMQAQCAKLTEKDIEKFQMVADKRIEELESSRDLSKIWLHSDMDAFFAAVETLENPSLEGKPLAVGSMSMISTANYEARKYGVRSAMPGFIAFKLCPELVLVPVSFDKYVHYSEKTRKVFRRYDPNFIATSLDEAYLDITEICKGRGVTREKVAEELRKAIYEETALTCSVGVAPNRLLAKIGGIGKVTEHILRDGLGISTCEDMLRKSAYICGLFSPSSVDFFLSVGLGLGNTETPQLRLRKSISNERTFSSTDDQSLLFKKLEETAEALSDDLQKESLFGRTLTLKLKTSSFEVKTRATSLQKFIQSKEHIFFHASKLLRAELPLSVRLIGLRMSHFGEAESHPADPTQRTLGSFFTEGTSAGRETISEPTVDHLDEEEESTTDLAPPSSTQQGAVSWLNDYICSLCGYELPPSFLKERQEHSDFHLAEILQKESPTPPKKRRKPTSNGSKHIPIEFFFDRTKEK